MGEPGKSRNELLEELKILRTRLEACRRLEREHLRVTNTLRDNSHRYRFLLDNAPLGFLVADREGNITELNRALLRILGSPSAKATRAINVLTFPLLVKAGVSADIKRCLDTKEPSVFEHPYTSQWGRTSYLRYHLNPITDDTGGVTGIQAIVEDFTARHRAEVALRNAHEQLSEKALELEQANAELNQFATAVSHDIKAPLRAIHAFVDILLDEYSDSFQGEPKKMMGNIARAVRQGEDLVDDLLQLSRIGLREATCETVDLGDIVRAAVSTLDLPGHAHLEIRDHWPEADTDPVVLRQILQNLLFNAAKFNDSDEIRIEIGWQELESGDIEIYVRDNGIGIDPRYHERVFNVFERLHTSAEYEGTGIGLALVRKAAHKLGGMVRLESALGVGSTFFVSLKRHRQPDSKTNTNTPLAE